MSEMCRGLPYRLRYQHDWCTPNSCRLAATPKSVEFGQLRTSAQAAHGRL